MSSFALGCIVGCIIGCATIAILGMGARSDIARDLDRVGADLATAKSALGIAESERDKAIAELGRARKDIEGLNGLIADSRGIVKELEKGNSDGLALIDKCIILARRIEEGLRETDKKP